MHNVLLPPRSVDRYLVDEFCARAGRRVTQWPVSNSTDFAAQMTACNTTSAFLLFAWINGAVIHRHPVPLPWVRSLAARC